MNDMWTLIALGLSTFACVGIIVLMVLRRR